MKKTWKIPNYSLNPGTVFRNGDLSWTKNPRTHLSWNPIYGFLMWLPHSSQSRGICSRMFTSFRTFLCLPFSYGLFYLIGFVSYFLLPSLPFPKLLPGCVSRPLLTLVVVSSGHSSTNHSLMTLSGRQSPSGEICEKKLSVNGWSADWTWLLSSPLSLPPFVSISSTLTSPRVSHTPQPLFLKWHVYHVSLTASSKSPSFPRTATTLLFSPSPLLTLTCLSKGINSSETLLNLPAGFTQRHGDRLGDHAHIL